MIENVDITFLITPTVDFVPPFTWEFKVGSGPFQILNPSSLLFTALGRDTAAVTMSIEAATSGDSVKFSDPNPIKITDLNGPVDVSPQGAGSSTITFTDENIAPATWQVMLFATYHDSTNDQDIPIASPDPTIVNDGIDHPIDVSSQERPKPVTSAV